MFDKHKKVIIVVLVLFLALLAFKVFYHKPSYNKKDGVFDTTQFKLEMKDRGYKFEIKDAEQDFLPTVRKRMIIGSEAIDIYRYDNNESMEEDAGRIDSGGCTYSGINSKKVSWTKAPHFYKKGNIIVLYVGNDRDIISHLSEILGNQFAGQ